MAREERLLELLYWAWTVIANANEGNWDSTSPEWREAATKWRDAWHEEIERGHVS